MAIDRSGEWWKGADFADLADYLRALTEDSCPVRIVLQCACACRAAQFRLHADQQEGSARRTCGACGAAAFIGDSEEHWEESDAASCACPCGGDLFELAVGFSLRADDEVRWITIGQRCLRCGIMGSFVDWEIDYEPTLHLFERV